MGQKHRQPERIISANRRHRPILPPSHDPFYRTQLEHSSNDSKGTLAREIRQ
jgi:hypothetical protein